LSNVFWFICYPYYYYYAPLTSFDRVKKIEVYLLPPLLLISIIQYPNLFVTTTMFSFFATSVSVSVSEISSFVALKLMDNFFCCIILKTWCNLKTWFSAAGDFQLTTLFSADQQGCDQMLTRLQREAHSCAVGARSEKWHSVLKVMGWPVKRNNSAIVTLQFIAQESLSNWQLQQWVNVTHREAVVIYKEVV